MWTFIYCAGLMIASGAAIIILLYIFYPDLQEDNPMSEIYILTELVKGGMSVIGACAMGGNMMAESGMKSNIAQRGMTKLSDDEYTRAADMGTIDFAHDDVGYGLCQWTFRTRKSNLLDFAKANGKSVGDESLQTAFCLKELQVGYPGLWNYLQYADNLYDATSRICKEYEQPAVNNIDTRAKYALELLQKYGELLKATPDEANNAVASKAENTNDKEPDSYIMPFLNSGEHTPETEYLRALLENKGYDVLWLGLDACLRDYQQKNGLTADGVCGEKTWRKLIG